MITLAGWAVVNWQNNQRERRKEDRATVDAVKKLVADLQRLALEDMSSAERDELRELNIKALIDQVEIELMRLPSYKPGSWLANQMADLADAATAGHFESSQRSPITPSHPLALDLLLHRNHMLFKLDRWFAETYRY